MTKKQSAKVAVAFCTRQGFAVEKTSDPVEGLARATNADYAAILLDIKMPAMTGLDFLSQLRSRRQDIPVILMTGFPSVPTAVSAISLGAAGYVTKPFTPEEITQAVHRFAVQASDGRWGGIGGRCGAGRRVCRLRALPTSFWHESWLREKADAEYRTGAVLAGLAAQDIETYPVAAHRRSGLAGPADGQRDVAGRPRADDSLAADGCGAERQSGTAAACGLVDQ